MKRCCKCKEFKSLDSFGYDKNTKDNLSYACKECNRIRVKLWATNNKKRKTEVNHNYNNTEKGFLGNLFNSIRKRDKL